MSRRSKVRRSAAARAHEMFWCSSDASTGSLRSRACLSAGPTTRSLPGASSAATMIQLICCRARSCCGRTTMPWNIPTRVKNDRSPWSRRSPSRRLRIQKPEWRPVARAEFRFQLSPIFRSIQPRLVPPEAMPRPVRHRGGRPPGRSQVAEAEHFGRRPIRRRRSTLLSGRFDLRAQCCRATITGMLAACATVVLTDPNSMPANPPRP